MIQKRKKEKKDDYSTKSLVRPTVKLQCLRIKFIRDRLPSSSSFLEKIRSCYAAWILDAKKKLLRYIKRYTNANIIMIIASTVLSRLSRAQSIMKTGRCTLREQINL